MFGSTDLEWTRGAENVQILGNGIDADNVLEWRRWQNWFLESQRSRKSVQLKANKIGSECFRLWKACDAQVGDDFHINPKK